SVPVAWDFWSTKITAGLKVPADSQSLSCGARIGESEVRFQGVNGLAFVAGCRRGNSLARSRFVARIDSAARRIRVKAIVLLREFRRSGIEHLDAAYSVTSRAFPPST